MNRTLRTLYTITAGWLAWCTGATAGHVPAYISVTLAAAALAHVLFGVHAAGHADELRQLRVQLERAARSATPAPVISPGELAAFEEIIAHYDTQDGAA